jgi:hypothetical protein
MYPAEPLNVQATVAAYDLDNLRLDVPGMPKALHVSFVVKDVLVGGQCEDVASDQPPNGLQVRGVRGVCPRSRVCPWCSVSVCVCPGGPIILPPPPSHHHHLPFVFLPSPQRAPLPTPPPPSPSPSSLHSGCPSPSRASLFQPVCTPPHHRPTPPRPRVCPAQLTLTRPGASAPYSDSLVMQNLGYFQLKANPGVWDLALAAGRASALYTALDGGGGEGDLVWLNAFNKPKGDAAAAPVERRQVCG